MMPPLSPNTQAILLLTAPLIVGRSTETAELLTPSEYKNLAQHLRRIKREPADLLQGEATEILTACQPVVDASRLRTLLGRGFQLSQALERWQSKAIWVVSRADAHYPRCIKGRLREDAPAVLYGCGDIDLLGTGGLAVVGSRNVSDDLVDYTMNIGRLAAHAVRTIVSGGARGVDKAAMRGALEAGGRVIGVLAENLEKSVMNREERNHLRDGRLVLVSAYDPSASFNVGHALQRNKMIYAFSNVSLVVNSDLNKGGTWAGAIEQLDKFNFVPVYVRSVGARSAGLDALKERGALSWPNPQSVEEFEHVFALALSFSRERSQPEPSLFAAEHHAPESLSSERLDTASADESSEGTQSPATSECESASSVVAPPDTAISEGKQITTHGETSRCAPPADVLYATVREVLTQLLKVPMKDAEVAEALNVSNAQAKTWLVKLVEDGVLEKRKNPVAYVAKTTSLFQ